MGEKDVEILESVLDAPDTAELEPKPKRRKLDPPVYIARFGLNYGCTDDDPNGVRVEAGDEVPASVIEASPWLIEQGHVAEKGASDE